MAKKHSPKKGNAQYKEDILFFRMSVFFVLCAAAVFFLLRLKDTVDLASDIYIYSKMTWCRIVSVLLAALSVGYFVFCRIRKIDESERSFSSGNLASVLCYLSGGFLYWGTTYSPRYDALITLTVAFALLYFIYHIYPRDFFVFSVSNLVFLSAAWLFTRGGVKFAIASAIALALCAVCCLWTHRQTLISAGSKRKKRVFEPIFISFLVTVVLISLSKFIGVPWITYSAMMLAIIVQYAVFGIYYTVKLIREAK